MSLIPLRNLRVGRSAASFLASRLCVKVNGFSASSSNLPRVVVSSGDLKPCGLALSDRRRPRCIAESDEALVKVRGTQVATRGILRLALRRAEAQFLVSLIIAYFFGDPSSPVLYLVR